MAEKGGVEVTVPPGLTPEEDKRVKEVVEAFTISFDLPPGGEVIARFPRNGRNLDDTDVYVRIKRK